MMRSKKTLVRLSAILVALSATPKLVSEALINQPVFAQAPTVSPTSLPLPESLPSGSQVKVDGSTSMAIINQELKNVLKIDLLTQPLS